ncbi:MAG: sugar phosphate nucleotidyltransferase [Firmicutes bacterium]|nr:sugar phosphate nucleotidyltransferase [Bacillota bacterium]
MNAVIMAGGYGSRLKPLTDALPKPMLNICNRPMIDYCVAQLAYYGLRDIVFSLGYSPERIIERAIGYVGIKTRFLVEDIPLGTLGGVKAAVDKLSDVFVVISGDGLNDIDLNALLNRHLAAKAEVTVAVKEVDDPSLYGVANLGDDGFIKGFVEKPHDIKSAAFVNCGTYAINKSALSYIARANCDFAKDLFPLLVARGKLGYYKHRGYWRDVGDFASYYHANFEMLGGGFFPSVRNLYDEGFGSSFVGGEDFPLAKGHEKIPLPTGAHEGFLDRGGVERSDGADTERNKSVGSLVANTAKIHGHISECIIGQGSMVDFGSSLSRCVVMPYAKVSGRHDGCIFGTDGVRIDVLDAANAQSGYGTVIMELRKNR